MALTTLSNIAPPDSYGACHTYLAIYRTTTHPKPKYKRLNGMMIGAMLLKTMVMIMTRRTLAYVLG
jgi:hypothetical protein